MERTVGPRKPTTSPSYACPVPLRTWQHSPTAQKGPSDSTICPLAFTIRSHHRMVESAFDLIAGLFIMTNIQQIAEESQTIILSEARILCNSLKMNRGTAAALTMTSGKSVSQQGAMQRMTARAILQGRCPGAAKEGPGSPARFPPVDPPAKCWWNRLL